MANADSTPRLGRRLGCASAAGWVTWRSLPRRSFPSTPGEGLRAPAPGTHVRRARRQTRQPSDGTLAAVAAVPFRGACRSRGSNGGTERVLGTQPSARPSTRFGAYKLQADRNRQCRREPRATESRRCPLVLEQPPYKTVRELLVHAQPSFRVSPSHFDQSSSSAGSRGGGCGRPPPLRPKADEGGRLLRRHGAGGVVCGVTRLGPSQAGISAARPRRESPRPPPAPEGRCTNRDGRTKRMRLLPPPLRIPPHCGVEVVGMYEHAPTNRAGPDAAAFDAAGDSSLGDV